MNKKGFEMAISTIVIIVLGIAVLVALIVAVRSGFKAFDNSRETILAGTEGSLFKQACELSCDGKDQIGYCCMKRELSGFNFTCTDSGVSCSEVSCAAVTCPA